MSCCGGVSAPMAQARGRALTDEGAARGALVLLEYTGDERRTLPYVAAGKPYFFGVNKRISAVPARVVPQFLDPAGRYYGHFVRYEAEVVSPQSGVQSSAMPASVIDPLGATVDESATDVIEPVEPGTMPTKVKTPTPTKPKPNTSRID